MRILMGWFLVCGICIFGIAIVARFRKIGLVVQIGVVGYGVCGIVSIAILVCLLEC